LILEFDIDSLVVRPNEKKLFCHDVHNEVIGST